MFAPVTGAAAMRVVNIAPPFDQTKFGMRAVVKAELRWNGLGGKTFRRPEQPQDRLFSGLLVGDVDFLLAKIGLERLSFNPAGRIASAADDDLAIESDCRFAVEVKVKSMLTFGADEDDPPPKGRKRTCR